MFYDRTDEQKQILTQLKKMEDGEAVVIIIEGKEGVGKTDLMRQCMKGYKKYAFKYVSSDYIYKCNPDNSVTEFSFISDVITALQSNQNKRFVHKLTHYFDKMQSISLREGITKLIPQIPGLAGTKDLFEYSTEQITKAKSVVNELMMKNKLIQCFSDIICEMLRNKKIIFCIDDIAWMDDSSFAVLLSVLRQKGNNGTISLFSTTRRKSELDSKYHGHYAELMDFINEGPLDKDNTADIVIHDFDLDLFHSILMDHQRDVLKNQYRLLHEMTSGNPLEINSFFKASDSEIIEKIDEYKRSDRYNLKSV